jgi:uncharacterized membrane protein YagU involved in acid resistance
MQQVNPARAILGGFIGTLVMTVLLLMAPLVGLPKIDFAAALGSLLSKGTPEQLSEIWWLGMVWHFVNGSIVFAMIYSDFIYGWLPGAAWARGLAWGLTLWLLMEIVFMPVMGRGVFADHVTAPVLRDLSTFVMHGAYGAILGAIAGQQTEHARHVQHPA